MSRTWHEIRRCRSPDEAETLRAALVDGGVEAIVPDAHVMGVQPMCRRDASAVRLLVRQDDAERARAILEGLRDDQRDAP